MGNAFTLANELAQGDNLFSTIDVREFDKVLCEVWGADDVHAVQVLSVTRLSTVVVFEVSSCQHDRDPRDATLWLMKALPRAGVLCRPLSAINPQLTDQADVGPGVPRITIASLVLGRDSRDKHTLLTNVELHGRRHLARSMRLLTHDGLAPFLIPYAAICTTPNNLLLGRPWPGEDFRTILEQASWPSQLSMQKWWTMQLLLALIQLHCCGLAHHCLSLECVSLGQLSTRLYVTGIGDASSNLPRIPRQQAAVFADLFMKLRRFESPSEDPLSLSRQSVVLTRSAADLCQDSQVSQASAPCFISPES